MFFGLEPKIFPHTGKLGKRKDNTLCTFRLSFLAWQLPIMGTSIFLFLFLRKRPSWLFYSLQLEPKNLEHCFHITTSPLWGRPGHKNNGLIQGHLVRVELNNTRNMGLSLKMASGGCWLAHSYPPVTFCITYPLSCITVPSCFTAIFIK